MAALAVPAQASDAIGPTLGQLVGQHLLIRMRGPVPSADLLSPHPARRDRRRGALRQHDPAGRRRRSLVRQLQAAARAGGQLPLLIAIDQEGGEVKRLPGPPTEAPSAMRSPADALAQGRATGRYLHGLDIGIDLAPVLDVPVVAAVVHREPHVLERRGGRRRARHGVREGPGRTAASRRPRSTSRDSAACAATRISGPVACSRRATALERDLAPFRAAIRAGTPAVMVGTAAYPAYSPLPAATSPEIVTGLLRGTLGFRGVTLSDDLATKGVRPWFGPGEATVRAVRAGIDMVYVAGVGGSGGATVGEQAYAALLRAARAGTISRTALQASYDRIAALKQRYG